MKRNCLQVNSKDAWTQWGVWVEEGGYNSVVAWAQTKGIVVNDWWEQDFEEVDTSRIICAPKSVSVRFCATSYDGYRAFMNNIFAQTYSDFYFAEIEFMAQMRYVSQRSFSNNNGLIKFEVNFVDDMPMQFSSLNGALTTLNISSPYSIDGNSIATYGAVVTGGTLTETGRFPNVKKNYEVNREYYYGQKYGGNNHLSGRDVSVNVLMRAQSLSELWNNYDALFFDLTAAGEHVIENSETSYYAKFYYKSNSVSRLYATGKIWLEHSIKLHIYEQ